MIKAIGMLEFTSIARGIYVTDQMIKAAEVETVTAVSSCPGKYIAIVHGDVASVNNAIEVGKKEASEYLVDEIIISNVCPEIFPAITGCTMPETMGAVGIIESFSIATTIIAADAILKEAELEPIEMRLGNGIGGKAFFVFTGDVAAVKAGMKAGISCVESSGLLVNTEIIPAPSEQLIPSLM